MKGPERFLPERRTAAGTIDPLQHAPLINARGVPGHS
jgi:hypothetical protein